MRIVERGWHRPHDGRVDRWISVVTLVATIATFALVNLGFRAVPDPSAWWICIALDVVFVGALVTLGASNRGLALSLHVAVFLPMFHVLVATAAWLTSIGLHVEPFRYAMPIDRIPKLALVCIVAGAVALGGIAAARDRNDTWRSICSVAIASLLLLGLWAPMAVRWITLDVSGCLATLAPPFVVASLYAVIAVRYPALVRALTPTAAIVIAVVALRCLCEGVALQNKYANFLPWILATALCAIGAILALAFSTHRATSRDAIEGFVIADHAIAGFVLYSWLRGPEPYLTEHYAQTPRGIAHVPASTHFVAPLTPSTTILRTGEYVPLLHPGDRVRLVGFALSCDGSPFRDAQTLVASDDAELHVATENPRDQLVLAAWRPALAYLVALVATCGPALVVAGSG